MSLKKIFPIKNSADFLKISNSGSKFHSHSITLISSKSCQVLLPISSIADKEFCRIGFTISKKVSKSAVKRNLAKRRLREIARELLPEMAKPGFDYVVIARREILNHTFQKISQDFAFCLRKIHQIQTSAVSKKSTSSQ